MKRSFARPLGFVAACVWTAAFVGFAAPRRAPAASQDTEARPARLSLVEGTVSFWRTGAEDWVRARLNTPLAPGDHLYASDASRFEVQFGAESFVRADAETELVLERLDPDYVQFRAAKGVMSVDVRSLDPDTTVEIDAPDAAFTIRHSGYYRVDVGEETTVFTARQGGDAEAVVAAGERWRVRSDEQVIVDPSASPVLQTYQAAEADEWDRWNAERTSAVLAAPSARELPRGVYGAETLDRYGTWDDEPTYGRVWYPREVEAQWAPYSDGHWVWDPGFGWTWIDDSPWGWAPFHYGRWVHVGPRWGWAPGPIAVRPFYAPAVVGFLAGPRVSVSIGIGPIGWVALGWGEPIVPWWGHRGFIGAPSWRGWGGPRIVNNVTIINERTVHVDRIVYSHTRTEGALMSVPRDRFGGGHIREARLAVDSSTFRPVRGALPVRPTSRTLAPYASADDRHVPAPSRRILDRATVAARKPADPVTRLGASGVRAAPRRESPGRVIVPKRMSSGVQEASNPAPAPPRREPVSGRDRGARGVEGQPQRPGGRDRLERSRSRDVPPPQGDVVPGSRGRDNEPAVAPRAPGAEAPRDRRPASERIERRSAPPAPPRPGVSAPERGQVNEPRREPRPLRPDRSEPPPLPPAAEKQKPAEEPRRPAPRERPARPESLRERPVPVPPRANPQALPPAAPPPPRREIAPRAAEPPSRPEPRLRPQERRQQGAPERFQAPAESQRPPSVPARPRPETMRAPERREAPPAAPPPVRQEPRRAPEAQQPRRAPEQPMRAPEAAPRVAPRAPEPARQERVAPRERAPQPAPPREAPPRVERREAPPPAAAPHHQGGPRRPQAEQ